MKDVTPSKMIGRTHDCTSYYPGLSSPFRESGEALIQYDVGADGTISNVLLLKSSGFPEIDGAALACVREQWRNTPAYVKDVPIATPGHRAIVRFTMH